MPGGGARLSDDVGPVFAALSDPTRRWMLDALMLEGSTSVPELSSRLPITRQAVAKHIAVLDHAGLLERAPGRGREVRYQLRSGAVDPAAAWMRHAQERWDARLGRLKDQLGRERASQFAYSTDPLASDDEETS